MGFFTSATPAGGLLGVVTQFLDDGDWKYELDMEKSRVRLYFSGDNGKWLCVGIADDEDQRLRFYSILDTNVPEDRRTDAAEYLTRANYGLILGNFEMDFEDGEVRYKTSIDVEGGTLTPTMVKSLLYTNLLTMDKYLPGLMKVIYAGARPKEAVQEVEAS